MAEEEQALYAKLDSYSDEDLRYPQSKHRPPWVKYCNSFARSGLEILMAITILLLVASKSPARGPDHKTTIPTPVPEFSMQTTVFMNDFTFSEEHMFTNATLLKQILANWISMAPAYGRGMVTISEPEKYIIGRPYNVEMPDSEASSSSYMITVFHQLHCLSNILLAYSNTNFEEAVYPSADQHHIAHCFDYLRQGIMCQADTTLEGDHSSPGNSISIPWGSRHMCKSFEDVKAWTNEHAGVNRTGNPGNL
ncbi:hypothetical protein F5884DRAFT_849203 [Xylogone sp. PMI_703]|nr:hypothetical protein F5884DRAFT_849203 [Xylogone sp. PMI_703]